MLAAVSRNHATPVPPGVQRAQSHRPLSYYSYIARLLTAKGVIIYDLSVG